jgi:hypothetical protein
MVGAPLWGLPAFGEQRVLWVQRQVLAGATVIRRTSRRLIGVPGLLISLNLALLFAFFSFIVLLGSDIPNLVTPVNFVIMVALTMLFLAVCGGLFVLAIYVVSATSLTMASSAVWFIVAVERAGMKSSVEVLGVSLCSLSAVLGVFSYLS